MGTRTSLEDRPVTQTPGIIRRSRLIDKLVVEPCRIILVVAPAGYGKTILATQYAQQSSRKVVWQTTDVYQRDAQVLYERCVETFDAVIPGFRDGLLPAANRPPEELAARIAGRLLDTRPGKMLYVLDDMHLLDGAPTAQRWLYTLVERLPDNCRLLLISRSVPDLPYIGPVARQEVLVLTQQDLRFDTEETERLAQVMRQDAPADIDYHSLLNKLEGWPAGITLAFHPLSAEMSGRLPASAEVSSPEGLFNALATSMFQSQPPDIQHFLLASSTVSRLTTEVCHSALALANAGSWLDTLQSRNLFLSRVPGGLAYHSLFRAFLQGILKERDPGRYADLHLSAARWMESRDNLELAFDHYLAAGAAEPAREIAERVAIAWFDQGRVETLLAWSDRLEAIGAEAPWLLYSCAMLHTNHYEFEEAIRKLQSAEQIFTTRQDQRGLDEIHLQQAIVHMLQGNHDQAIAGAKPLAEHPSPGVRGRALRIMGAAYMNRGDLQEGLPYLEEAVVLCREAGLVSSLSHLLQDLQHTYTRLGYLEKAGAQLQEVVAIRRQLGGAGALAMALNNLGYHYYQFGDYQQARSTFEEGLRLIAGIPDRRAEAYLQCSLGDLMRDLGEYQKARRLYEQALEKLVEKAEPGLRSFVLTSLSILCHRQGRGEDAVMLARDALKVARKSHNHYEADLAEMALWVARAGTESHEEAFQQLEKLLAHSEKVDAPFERMGLYARLAHLMIQQGNQGRARDYLSHAVEIANGLGTAQPLAAEIIECQDLQELLTDLPGGDIAQQHIRLLQKARSQLPAQPPLDLSVSGHTYSLTIYALGQEQVIRDAQAVSSSQWQAAGARELFFYLLFNGPQSKESINLAFWPEYDAEQVRALFHTTLHRARNALGGNAILYQDNRYQINPDMTVWCDALEFEQMVERARSIPSHDARAEDLWRRANDLYQGDLLPTLDADWIMARREKLRDQYVEALIGLGECAHVRGNLTEALNVYRKALTVDPYQETVHLEIMRCFAELGQPHRAYHHFEDVVRIYREDLGIVPSSRLRNYLNTL